MPNHRSRNPQGHRKHSSPEPSNVVPLTAVPTLSIPDPPIRLTKVAKEVWESFWSSEVSRVVDTSDHYALRRWIQAVNDREKIAAKVRKMPLVDGSQGQPVMNPLAKRLGSFDAEILKFEIQFGMTPKARADLGVSAGTAAMTAAQLNRMAQEDEDDDTIDGDAEEYGEFEEAD